VVVDAGEEGLVFTRKGSVALETVAPAKETAGAVP